jgi:hypothetical protein
MGEEEDKRLVRRLKEEQALIDSLQGYDTKGTVEDLQKNIDAIRSEKLHAVTSGVKKGQEAKGQEATTKRGKPGEKGMDTKKGRGHSRGKGDEDQGKGKKRKNHVLPRVEVLGDYQPTVHQFSARRGICR